MSTKVLSHVMKSSRSVNAARLVLFVLAEAADESGICWPGHAAIAAGAAVSEKTVERSIEELERLGELAVEKGTRRGNRYQVRVPWAALAIEARPTRPAPTRRERRLSDPRITDTGVRNQASITDTGVGNQTPSLQTRVSVIGTKNTDTGVQSLQTPVSVEPSKNLKTQESKPKAKTKDSLAPKKTARDRDELFDAIAASWDTRAGGLIGQIKSLLLGRSKAKGWTDANLDTPVTDALEVRAFAFWYHDTYPGLSMPTSPARIQKHFYDFRDGPECGRYLTLAGLALEDERDGPSPPDVDATESPPPDPIYAAYIREQLNALAEGKQGHHAQSTAVITP